MKTPQTKTAINTASGDFFDYSNPEIHDFNIDDIATALSNLCRYGGHTSRFYSVAEHSILVSLAVPPEMALEGLMHDASEAYCVDVPSPLKRMLPEYIAIEDRVQKALFKFFNLQHPFSPEVHEADKRLYLTERLQLDKGPDALWFVDKKPLDNVAIMCYNPILAKKKFLQRYNELVRDRDRNKQVLRQRAA